VRELRLLRGAGAEEAQDHAGGSPVIVLGHVGAKGGAVIVEVDDADFPAVRDVEVHSAARFVGNAVLRCRASARPTYGDVVARSAYQAFHKWGHPPAARAVEEAPAEVIAVENIFNAGAGDVVVAGVADNLEPGLQVVAKRAHCAAEVRRGAAAADAVERVAGIELDQEVLGNAGKGPLPARTHAGVANGLGSRLSRFGLNSFSLRLRNCSGRRRWLGSCRCRSRIRRRGRWLWQCRREQRTWLRRGGCLGLCRG